MRGPVPWRTTPLRARIVFLAAVFFVFAGIGIANDITDMGRWPPMRFGLSVVVIGLFAVAYAASGVILRQRIWIAMLPLLATQFATMGFLAHYFPIPPQPIQLNAAETERLHARLGFDGMAVIVTVLLGYIGFVHVSISEAKRYGKTQAEKAALDGEMAAAREVQRLMVPQILPSVRGYTIESVYRPAAEVGGDFFQVIRLKSGRTLLVIGDVSGKGLSAAMIVSTIVGMLWVVSAFTEEPAEILSELNRRLYGRTQDGFATCLVVRLEADGFVTQRTLRVVMDPRITLSPGALREQYALATRLCSVMNDSFRERAAAAASGFSKQAAAYDALNSDAGVLLDTIDGADAAPTRQADRAVGELEARRRALQSRPPQSPHGR